MGLISRTGDIFYAFRFLKMLTTPWDKMPAFEQGIIDDNGKVLKKASTLKTSEEKSSYTVFHRLVFNLKRLLQKLPFGKTKLASYAAALFLIKEHTGMSEKKLQKLMSDFIDDSEDLVESKWFQEGNRLRAGTYTLTEDVCSIETGEVIAPKNSNVRVESHLEPHASLFGHNIYEVLHPQTNQKIYITNREIKR